MVALSDKNISFVKKCDIRNNKEIEKKCVNTVTSL